MRYAKLSTARSTRPCFNARTWSRMTTNNVDVTNGCRLKPTPVAVAKHALRLLRETTRKHESRCAVGSKKLNVWLQQICGGNPRDDMAIPAPSRSPPTTTTVVPLRYNTLGTRLQQTGSSDSGDDKAILPPLRSPPMLIGVPLRQRKLQAWLRHDSGEDSD